MIASAALAYMSSREQNDAARKVARQQMAPFRLQSPFLRDLYSQAQNLYRSGAGGTPDLSPETMAGMGQIGELAFNPFMPMASNSLAGMFTGDDPTMNMMGQTASGAFLGNNPYIDSTFNKAADSVSRQYSQNVVPGVRSQFGVAGGYNRGSEAQALGSANRDYGQMLNNLATDIYGGNYARERGLMETAQQRMGDMRLSALNMVPAMNQANYYGANQLLGAGSMMDQFNQQRSLDPWRRLQMYQGALSSNPPSTNITPYQMQNPFLSAMGGALYGYGMMNRGGSQTSNPNQTPTTTMV